MVQPIQGQLIIQEVVLIQAGIVAIQAIAVVIQMEEETAMAVATLMMVEARRVVTDADAKELANARRQVARVAELSEAVACREDEIFGPGVMTSYDHTERFS